MDYLDTRGVQECFLSQGGGGGGGGEERGPIFDKLKIFKIMNHIKFFILKNIK
jgi:hypothetical protein